MEDGDALVAAVGTEVPAEAAPVKVKGIRGQGGAARVYLSCITGSPAPENVMTAVAMVRNRGQAVKVGQVMTEVIVLVPKPATCGPGASGPDLVSEVIPVSLQVTSIVWCASPLSSLAVGEIAIVRFSGTGTEHVLSGRFLS